MYYVPSDVIFLQSKTNDLVTEGVTISTPSHPVPSSVDSYEKSFWPYLQKIIQVCIKIVINSFNLLTATIMFAFPSLPYHR